MQRVIEIQPHLKAKQVLAGILATAAVVTGGVFAGKAMKKKGNNIVSPTAVVTEFTENKVIESGLNSDFDINDAKAVQERAEAIYAISKKEISVKDIMNLIYLANEEFESIDFGSATTDADKYKFLQELILKIEGLLGDNVPGYVNVLAGNQETAEGEFVHSAYLLAKDSEGKRLAIELENVVEEQKENIINGATDKYEATSKKYIDVMNRILKAIKEGKLTNGEATHTTKDHKAKFPLVSTYISKIGEYQNIVAELDKNLASYTNLLGQAAVARLGIQAAVEDLERNFKQTPVGSSYNASDAKEAQAIIGDQGEKTIEEQPGGVDLGKEQEVLSEGKETGSNTSEKIVEPNTEGYMMQETKEESRDLGRTVEEWVVDLSPEVIEELAGGDEVPNADGSEERIDSEEIPNTEPSGETYSDADAPTEAPIYDSNAPVTYVDADGVSHVITK